MFSIETILCKWFWQEISNFSKKQTLVGFNKKNYTCFSKASPYLIMAPLSLLTSSNWPDDLSHDSNKPTAHINDVWMAVFTFKFQRQLPYITTNLCLKDTSGKLHINFQISTFLGSAPSPMCLRSVIMESKSTMVFPDRSLGGVWHTGCPKYTSRKLLINIQMSFLLKSGPTCGKSRASSKCHLWSLGGRWRFLGGFFVDFEMVDVPRIH